MHRPNAPVSLADLSAAGVRLRPYEAVTIVRELVLQVIRGEIAGVPSSQVIRLATSGAIFIEGPVAAGGRPTIRAAQLLESLLPGTGAGDQFRIPGGLKLVIARALGTLDLPPFTSLEPLAEALGRFSATDSSVMVRDLVTRWSECVAREPAPGVDPSVLSAHVEPFVAPRPLDSRGPSSVSPLSVSDIRRARRSTGMSLAQVSERSRIPLGLLRQLEWGYLFNWPGGKYGRTQLVRYARATGLDEQLVVATMEPLIAQAQAEPTKVPVRQPAATVTREVVAEPVPEIQDIVIRRTPALPWPVEVDPPTPLRTKVLAALAIPALLAIGLVPTWWGYSVRPSWAPVASLVQSDDVERTTPRDRAPAAATEPTQDAPADAPGLDSAAPPQQPAAAQPQNGSLGVKPGDDTTPTYRVATDNPSFSPSFASVGTAMFYHDRAEGPSALMRADADSRGSVLRITRIVDDSASNFHVRPSPDGSMIAFDSDRGGVRGVYVADADGRHVRRVSPEGFAAVPSWSPDGTRLAFVRAKDGRSSVWNLWTLDLATGDLNQVTRHRYGQPWGGSWFPDGRRIAYSHEERLIIRDLETEDERVFATPRRGRLVRTPAVSPDGRRIIFQVQRDGVWLLELADGSMRKILDDPTAEEFTWSPDGKRVAYHSRRAGAWNLWVMAPR